MSLTTLAAIVAAIATALMVAPAASAAPTSALAIPATCTDASANPVGCTLNLIGFSNQGGTLNAVFQLTNTATGAVTNILVPVTSQQDPSTCTILDLTIQPIDLFLLGLHLHTDTIHLFLTAQRGTLLGNLLCGLFFGSPTPGLLNNALRQGLITLA
jgi:hypothetical protein